MLAYHLLFYSLLPLLLLRLLWRGIKAPAYWRRWPERFGFIAGKYQRYRTQQPARTAQTCLWIHAVSLGEALAAKPLVERCLRDNPQLQVVMTCSTPTGSQQITRMFGERVFHVYAPYDLPGSVGRFIKTIQPDLFLIMETEIWPTMISQCQQKNIPAMLVNGRLSEKSARRYQTFFSLSRLIFSRLDTIFAQSESDAGRFNAFASKAAVVTGSIKSDIEISEELKKTAHTYRQKIEKGGERQIIIAASTHRGEDELLLQVYSKLKVEHEKLLLMLVPRHPERFETVAALCHSQGLKIARKSSHDHVGAGTDIFLGDTIGDLLLLYGLADIAIVGGTFIDRGGHNFLEPAAWGLPIISGKSVFNFATIAHDLVKKEALKQVESGEELVDELSALLIDNDEKQRRGAAAASYLNKQGGALDKIMEQINSRISDKDIAIND